MAWSRSDIFAAAALLVSLGTVGWQYTERNKPFDVQKFVERSQASNNIVEAIENLIRARQLAMVSIERNVYERQYALSYPLDQLNADARTAAPVIAAYGNLNGVLQTHGRRFVETGTQQAILRVSQEATDAVACFTTIASARNKLNQQQLDRFRTTIAEVCEGANIPGSLDRLKEAENDLMLKLESELSELAK